MIQFYQHLYRSLRFINFFQIPCYYFRVHLRSSYQLWCRCIMYVHLTVLLGDTYTDRQALRVNQCFISRENTNWNNFDRNTKS